MHSDSVPLIVVVEVKHTALSRLMSKLSPGTLLFRSHDIKKLRMWKTAECRNNEITQESRKYVKIKSKH